MEKDRFGQVIEPGDTILRPIYSYLQERKVVRVTPNYLYVERTELEKKWCPDTPLRIYVGCSGYENIINITKLKQDGLNS